MPTLISIPTGYHGTSTIVVTPTVTLLFFHKKELNQAEFSPYLKQTGIYILYNQDQIYVGQSSNKDGLITRLRKHNQEKLWWEHTIVILPTQLMTKAHYDYMERTYIQMMSQRNQLTNKNIGNNSPITQLEMEQCEVLMGTINSICSLFNINIYQLTTKKYHQQLEEMIQQLLDGTFDD